MGQSIFSSTTPKLFDCINGRLIGFCPNRAHFASSAPPWPRHAAARHAGLSQSPRPLRRSEPPQKGRCRNRCRNRWGKCEKMWLEALVVFGSTWFNTLTHPLPSPSWSNGIQRWASGHSRPGTAQRPLYTFRELQDVCPCEKSSIFCWRVKSIRRSPCLKYLSINMLDIWYIIYRNNMHKS